MARRKGWPCHHFHLIYCTKNGELVLPKVTVVFNGHEKPFAYARLPRTRFSVHAKCTAFPMAAFAKVDLVSRFPRCFAISCDASQTERV